VIAELRGTDSIDNYPKRSPLLVPSLALAAAFLIGLATVLVFRNGSFFEDDSFAETYTATDPWTHQLPDGSFVRLNENTNIEVSYQKDSRRVFLKSGEAHFTVAEDPQRAFNVKVNGVTVAALGTAFNVRLSEQRVDVIVTDGTVEIQTQSNPKESQSTSLEATSNQYPSSKFGENKYFVSSGQWAEIVYLNHQPSSAPNIRTIDPEDERSIQKALYWQNDLLFLSGNTLAEIAKEFEQKTGFKLIFKDQSLRDMRIGGRYPSDDPVGFLRVLRSGFGIEWRKVEKNTYLLDSSA